MTGLPWIKVATDLPEHPKSVALAKRLDDPRAWAWPVRLWMFCARFNAEGRFRDADAVEEAAGWTGKTGTLASALAAVRFLDRHGRAYSVHAWNEWAMPHVERLRKDRERKKKERRVRATSSPGNGASPRDVPGTSTGRPVDVHALEGEGDREGEGEERRQQQGDLATPDRSLAKGGCGGET